MTASEQFSITDYAYATIRGNVAALGAEFPPDAVQVASNAARKITLVPLTALTAPPGAWSISGGDQGGSGALFNPPNDAPSGERELTGIERGAFADRLIVLNNFWPTGSVQEPAYQFSYVSYVLWRMRSYTVTFPFRDDMQTFGYPSQPSGVPTAGTRSFASVVRTSILTVSADRRYTEEDAFGTANISVNFSTNAVNFTFALSVVRNGATVVLGTINGTGTISGDRSRLSGSLTSSDSGLSGQFVGSFYGPVGQELGLAFGLNGPVSGGAQAAEQRIVGALLGK
jgi:hypothetical protein